MSELEGWYEEKSSAYLYRVLSEKEKGTPREKLFRRLSEEAENQALIWEKKIETRGLQKPSSFSPSFRTRLIVFLLNFFGPRQMKSILAAAKVRGMSVYSSHHPLGHDMPEHLSDVGKRHRVGTRSGNNLRAAIFGANDGLVSNTSLILGVAAAATEPNFILVSGSAGLLAGACSMAAGEYISVRSQREVFEYQIGLEREELREYPEEEAKELALIYEAKGMESNAAHEFSKRLISDPEKALDTLAREELGINPEELGSPWGAAIFSFLSFAIGAVVPLLPYIFLSSLVALGVAVTLSAISLFGIGLAIALFTGKNALYGGFRMLGIGALAGSLTYIIGHWLGTVL